MRPKLLSFLVLCIGFSSISWGQSSAGADMEAAKNEIRESNRLFNEAFVKGDSAATVSLYHSEAIVYPPHMKTMSRRNEMGSLVATVPSMGLKSATLTSTEIISAGDLVIETGTFEMSDSSKVVEKGKYMVVWKKENGKYKMYRDIWNSDNPPM